MKLYSISGPTISKPTYAIGLVVARLVAQTHTSDQATKPQVAEAQHPHPAGSVSVGNRQYRIWFPPGAEQMVLARLRDAKTYDGFVCISADRDDLCCSAKMLQLFQAQLEKKGPA